MDAWNTHFNGTDMHGAGLKWASTNQRVSGSIYNPAVNMSKGPWARSRRRVYGIEVFKSL